VTQGRAVLRLVSRRRRPRITLRIVVARWVPLGAGLVASVALATGAGNGRSEPAGNGVAVLQHHMNPTRDGHYVDPAFTRAAASRLHRDPGVHAPLRGPVYAQPLFWAATRSGEKDLVIVATEQNEVSALDAASGAPLWRRKIGAPVARRDLPCGNIDPLGITGTPIIDAGSRTIFLDAMTTLDGGKTGRHLIAALAVDDGAMRPGWPVDASTLRAGSFAFNAEAQNQRGALARLGGTVYVPYGGHFGDCADYHGWVVGVPIDAPRSAKAWATRARGGGIWAPGGIASDGHALFVATGNTMDASTWSDGEAIIRLGPGPTFTPRTDDFFAPADWRALDESDRDLGGAGPVLIDVPGPGPGALVVALGKDGKAYLIDRKRMGGIGGALVTKPVARGSIITAAAAYTTARGNYVVFKGSGRDCPGGKTGDLTALRIEPASPPSVSVAWCAEQHGAGSPIVTTTDGRSEAIVWSVGAEGDNRLRGFDGDTGQVIFDGGGATEAMSQVRRYQTPIVARGRIFVAADTELYAFTLR
jgi:putative pyrroloquinoline-quinone binding quinoprotein